MEDILTTLARQFLPQMEPEERAEALRSLKKMIDEEFFELALGEQPERPETSCPRCGSWHVVKKGHEPDGSQRYLCRSCKAQSSGGDRFQKLLYSEGPFATFQ